MYDSPGTLVMSRAEKLARDWQARLSADYPAQPDAVRDGILHWLIGADTERFEDLPPEQWMVVQQAIEYRYRILRQRYVGVSPERAYRNLLQRLASLSLVRSKVQTWVSLSRDRQRSVMDVLQEVVQELIQSDKYIRQQMEWIAQCSEENARLRNALLLASVEEYCLRPIRNQPLLVYRFVNYLRRTQRSGLTQVPANDIIRTVSEELQHEDADGAFSLTDFLAIEQYQEQQDLDEQHRLRGAVLQEFKDYLTEKIGEDAAQWLELHVQGHTQEAIAKRLDLEIKQVYRLREKIAYHAKNVFATKLEPELVATWLGTSAEQNFGLSTTQWQQFFAACTDGQKQLLEQMKTHQDLATVAQLHNQKLSILKGEWTKLCLEAYALRSASTDSDPP
ncbi:MAG: HetZ-related protein 2 [Cyanobacteria bacterium J06638_20]